MSLSSTSLARLQTLRPGFEAILMQLGEDGIAILQSDIAAGQFTGALAFLQPDFPIVVALVNFYNVILKLEAWMFPNKVSPTASTAQVSMPASPPSA
jgi:hypothetical protein